MSYEDTCSLQDALKKWDQDDCGLDKAVMEKFKNRKVVFFIGAGVSRLEGIMGWDDFSNELIKEAFPLLCDQEQLLRSNISSKEKISIAYEKFRKDNNIKKFYEEFGKALTPKSKPLGMYKILAQFNVNYLTTNADNLFGRVLGRNFCYTNFDKEKLFNQDHISRGQLFYLHGKYRKNSKNTNLVFTASNYVKRYNDKNFCDFLKQVFNNDCAVFFIGYGLNEYEIIDYISTKVGLKNKGESSLIYSLEPFFSNQETLFSARRLYFQSLGIKILPYCKDTGYSQLKDVLNKMLLAFKSQANVPHDDYQDIRYNLNKKCTKSLVVAVNRILRENIDDGRFGCACDVLKKSEYWDSWGDKIIADKLWFPSYTSKNYLEWNDLAYNRGALLYWLILNSGKGCYVSKAQNILDGISKESKKSIELSNINLIIQYINIICCFNNSLLKNDYFDFTDIAFKLYGMQICYLGLPKESVIFEWNNKYLKRFLLSVFNGMPDVNNILFEEGRYFLNYFEKNCPIPDNEKVYSTFFDAFYDYTKSKIQEDTFNPLYYISNLDNVQKAHYRGWQAILEKLVLYFTKLNREVQKQYIEEGLQSENSTICKIWLYILRHTLADTSFLLNDTVKCFMCNRCLCELYLLIMDSKYNNIDELRKKIDESSFGINLELYGNTYLAKIKNSLKFALGDKVEGEKYDLLAEADQCDYVHIIDAPKENFNNDSIEDIIEKMKNEMRNYEKSNIAEAVVQKFLELQDDQLKLILEKINELEDDKINFIILQARMKEDYLNECQKTIICVYALKILLSERSNDLLIKNCFALLARANLKPIFDTNEDLITSCWKKWKNKQIKQILENINKKQKEDVIFQVINTAEYERVSFLCNYWVTKKNLQKTISSNEFLECLKINARDITSRWCFSFRIGDIIGIAGEDSEKELINTFVYNNENIDYIAALIIVCSMRTVTKDVCDLITSLDILNKKDILNIDKQLTATLYRFCSAAYFYGKLKLTDIQSALNNDTFCEAIFFFLNVKIAKNDSLIIKKFEVEIWPEIKTRIQKNIALRRTVYRLMQALLLDCADNTGLIDIIIEILSMCQNEKEGIYIEGRKIIEILKKHPTKAKELTKLILMQSNINIYYGDIETILKYWAEEDKTFAEELLVKLHSNKIISLEYYEKLFNIINCKKR